MKKIVLFIDDLRNPYKDSRFDNHLYLKSGEYEVKIARSSNEAISLTKEIGIQNIANFCFDHDLGEKDTIRQFINWMFYDLEPKIEDLPDYTVHSDNPTAKEWIDSMFDSYEDAKNYYIEYHDKFNSCGVFIHEVKYLEIVKG